MDKQIVAAAMVLMMTACAAAPETGQQTPSPPFNANVSVANDCWARLYEQKNQRGRVLTIAGPARVADLAPHWGFPWDPRYESLSIGPGAVLALYDDANFHDRTGTFKPETSIADLDKDMGVFRRVRSLSVSCVPTKPRSRE